MTMKQVPLLFVVLLGMVALSPAAAVASDCDTTRCGAGVDDDGKCKTHADFSCDEVCNDNGCDGGDSVGGEFNCGGVGPWKMCQCNDCDLLMEMVSFERTWGFSSLASSCPGDALMNAAR